MRLRTILFVWILFSCPIGSAGETETIAVKRGREFLAHLLIPELDLLPEFAGHHVVWLYHDNYLAAKVLAKSHPSIAERINASIRKYGVERSGKIELLYGESSLPIRRYELRDVAQEGKFKIRSEFSLDALNNDFVSYADLLCFSAIAEKETTTARGYLDAALTMWDGSGFADRATSKSEMYATYKLALFLVATQRFEIPISITAPIQERLLKMQAASGGWVTDYRADGTSVGFANVETTSLAILALDPHDTRRSSKGRESNVEYGSKAGTALTMDVFRPSANANGAGVILVVSGGWASSASAINAKYAAHFVDRGYTVFAVVHSSNPKFMISDIIPDLHRAVRFIRHNANRFGIEPNKLGVTGASSGGHLALILGTQGDAGPENAADPIDRESSVVQAVACFFPPTDFLNYVKPDKNAMDESVLKNFRRFIGSIPDDPVARDALGRSISPIYAVSSTSAPTLIIHGEKDQHVLLHQSSSFVEAMKVAGATARLIVKPGKPHGWPEMGDDVESFVDWFDQYMLSK